MSRLKIDYGIDLGTTNSSIARMENGKVRIIKNPQTQMDTTPSAIHYTPGGQLFVGWRAYQMLGKRRDNWDNTFVEFKRTMGTDLQYYSPRMGEHYSSEQLSAEILKALKSFVRDEEEISAAVITVPADFQQVQIDATQKAAELAGFEYCELLQEPIAASLAYGFDKRNILGHWLVFDFGGGTFDAALVGMDEGIIKAVDHDGDNHLGGKDMDWLIVDNIIIPHLKDKFTVDAVLGNDITRDDLRNAWKLLAEEAKIRLSIQDSAMIEPDEPVCKDDNGAPIDTVIRIERSRFENMIERMIDRAIKMAKDLILRNRVSPADLETVLLVGGPTYIPYLRERVKEEINRNINVTIDPMTVVAKGAAIFASTLSIPTGIRKRDTSRVQLILGYPATTVETEISLGLKIDREKTERTAPDRMFAEIIRADKGWATGKIELINDAAVVRLYLLESRTNEFAIQLCDDVGNRVDCEPNSVSILQGIRLGSPTLPHDIGISAIKKDSTKGDESLAVVLKKNQTLPATGKRTFMAPKMIRPGNPDDVLGIIVWEGKAGTKPRRNVWVGQVRISGEMLPSLLPEGSEVEITIRMDESRRVTVSAFFPYLDKTIERVLDTGHRHPKVDPGWIETTLKSARWEIEALRDESLGIEEGTLGQLDAELDEIEDMKEKGRADFDRAMMIKNRLNELLIKLDGQEKSLEWPRMERKANEEISVTKETVERYGTDDESRIFNHFHSKVEKALERKERKLIDNTISELQNLKWHIWSKQPGFWVSVLTNIDECFNEIHWVDRARARSLLDGGKDILSDRGYSEDIPEIVRRLWELMPEDEREKTKTVRDDIPHY